MNLDAIGIVGKDIEKSLEFYRLLGLKFPKSSGGEDHVEASTPGGLRVMIDSEKLMKELKPDWVKPAGQRMSLAFKCDSSKHVDETYKKVVAAGFKGGKEPWDAFWGQRYAFIVDPDGNSVDLFAPL